MRWSMDDANDEADNGFIYSNGQLTRMPNGPGGLVYAVAINNSGVSVGTDGFGHGFSYQNGIYTDLGPYSNLGSLSGGTWATAINNNGLIVGYAAANSFARPEAAEYINGQWEILGMLPGDTNSRAIAVNDNGDVLGVSQNVGTNSSTPFIYTDGQMYDLLDLLPSGVPDPSVNDYTVTGMNDAGQIVGYIGNIDAENPLEGFVLTPVPEPGIIMSLLFCSTPLVMRRRSISHCLSCNTGDKLID
jgi:probable HAF family extracellular repeat protein